MYKKLSLKELNRVDVKTFKAQEKTPVVLVLDNVRSALNVGSAFRTSDAFNLEKIVLCGITATPPHREILKTAIGATESVDWVHKKNITDAIEGLKKEGYQILAVEQTHNSMMLQDFRPIADGKYAIIMGNEVKGVSDEALALVDNCIEIPQFGTKHSLNVSVCAGIIIWDIFQKMKYSNE